MVTFAKSGNEDDFAEKMIKLIRDPAARRRQVRNADEFIKLNNWDVRKSEYLNLVDTLTGNLNSTPSNSTEKIPVR
jgi:glycosyltransferase involved in cell wall biosynthesis